MNEKHVLVILPHPDDEAFGISGTLALHIENDTPVTYVCCTLGEMGRSMGNPPFATRESLPKIRKRELEAACQAIGLNDLRLQGLRDKTLEFEDEEELADLFLNYIKELNPSLIITFYPGYSVHPDHNSCGEAVINAVKKLPENKRPKVECLAFSHDCEEHLGKPDIVRDVSSVLEKKIACIKSHRSQIQNFRGNLAKKIDQKDPETMNWIKTERFWSYQWN